MNTIILEGQVNPRDISFEDGGCAVLVEPDWIVNNGDNNFFVKFQSWDDEITKNPVYDRSNSREENAKLGHESIQKLFGKKVRVTVEILE